MACAQIFALLYLLNYLFFKLLNDSAHQWSYGWVSSFIEKSDILLTPSRGISGGAPNVVLPAILLLELISNDCELLSEWLSPWDAGLVVSFNLPGLVWVKVREIVQSICPFTVVIITFIDLVCPLSCVYGLSLFSVSSYLLFFFLLWLFSTKNRLASNLADDYSIISIEVYISLHSLQYIALIFIADCFGDETASDLFCEFSDLLNACVKILSWSSDLNIILVNINAQSMTACDHI